MPRITVNVSEEIEAWLTSEADALGISKARVGGHCIEVMYSTVDHINLHQSTVDADRDDNRPDHPSDLAERVDELEARLDDLEDSVDATSDSAESGQERAETAADARTSHDTPSGETRETGGVTPPETPDHSPAADEAAADEPADVAIDDALRGWQHGRGEEEQEASAAVARRSLSWLRKTPLDEVRKSDVPLDEFADDDPLDRTAETLWSQVVRAAWEHAADRGYVDQPTYRSYAWQTPDDGEDSPTGSGVYDPTEEFE